MTEDRLAKTCPNCGAKMPINFGFRTWCSQCDYNLDEPRGPHAQPHGLIERVLAWQRGRLGDRPLKQAAALQDLRLHVSPALVLLYLLAGLAQAFTLVLIYVIVSLLVRLIVDYGQVYLILSLAQFVAAFLLFLVVWKVMPRTRLMPAQALRHAQALETGTRALFALIDRIAQALNAPPVQAVYLTAECSVSLMRCGPNRDNVLKLGLPLLFTLDAQELVAVLAHALAHNARRDPRQTWLIETTSETLAQWQDMFRINRSPIAERTRWVGFYYYTLRLIMFVLSLPFWLAAIGFTLLLTPVGLRAEFRADALAAQTAGTPACLRLLRKLYLHEAMENIFYKAMFSPQTKMMAEIRERMRDVPEREMERINRVIQKDLAPLDPALPATRDRLAFLQSRAAEPAQIVLSSSDYNRIMAELIYHETEVEQAFRAMQSRPVDAAK